MEKVAVATVGLIIGVFFVVLSLMLAWNYAVVSAIEVANPINFWQALVLIMLLKVLRHDYAKKEK